MRGMKSVLYLVERVGVFPPQKEDLEREEP
jgi:hypothetical protein